MALRLKGNRPAPGEADKRYYIVDIQEKLRRERLSTGTRDKELALRREQAVLDALREDPNISKDELKEIARGAAWKALKTRRDIKKSKTFKEACNACLSDPNGWGKIDGSKTYASNCNMLQEVIGADTPVASIDLAICESTVEKIIESGNSETTANRKMFALLSVLRHAKKAGDYPHEIPEYEPFDEDDKARQLVLTHEEEATLFAQVANLDEREMTVKGGHPIVRDATDYADVFMFLMDIGCRHSQAYRVRWRDIVEVKPGVYAIRFWNAGEQKGGLTRTVPCTDRVTAMLARRKKEKGGDGPFHGMTRSRATKLWRLAKAKVPQLANEKECVPHCLRHTCATRLLQVTGNLKLVQEWLGHTKIETTGNIYAKVLIDTKIDALAALQAPKAPGVPHIPTQEQFQDRNLFLQGNETATKH